MSIEEFSFRLNPFLDCDWTEAIERAGGAKKTLLREKQLFTDALRSISDYRVTPHRLGWMTLWTRGLAVIQGTISALEGKSEFTLKVLSRAAFESMLHLQAIINPIGIPTDDEDEVPYQVGAPKGFSLSHVHDRFAAYVAWCLWEDKGRLSELISTSTAEKIWSPQPACEMSHEPKQMQPYEALFGPLDIETRPNPLREAKEEQRVEVLHRIARIERWLSDSRLQSWV